mgnify:CR=1 FL=1
MAVEAIDFLKKLIRRKYTGDIAGTRLNPAKIHDRESAARRHARNEPRRSAGLSPAP